MLGSVHLSVPFGRTQYGAHPSCTTHPAVTTAPHARIRPDIRYAWRGPSMLIVDNAGAARADAFHGFFFRETRFLSEFRLEVAGAAPVPSSAASIRPEEIAFTCIYPPVELTGVGSGTGGGPGPHGLVTRNLDFFLRLCVHPASFEAILHITSRWQERVDVDLAWVLAADFASLDAAKAGRSESYGPVRAEPAVGGVVFRHEHPVLPFETHVHAEGGDAAWAFRDGRLAARLVLERQRGVEIVLRARALDRADPIDEAGERAREAAAAEWRARVTRLHAPGHSPLATLANRATDDLGSMALMEGDPEEWLAPAAGYPLYPSFWARDALTAAWQAAVFDRGAQVEAVLPTLARLQGTRVDPRRAEQPGRIVRQNRKDPRARLGDTPYDRYYADFASPFMFIIALGNAYAWSGERSLLVRYRDTATRILDWAREYGDRDGDGFLEYLNPSEFGPPHEGWKDSDNAVVHADGTQAVPPIAPAEIQGYWFVALRFMTVFSAILGEPRAALAYWREAAALRERFNRDFWLDDEGVPPLGLDADKRPIRTVASNAGHCLTTGIIDESRLERVVERLFQPDMFSGWGIRTISALNPAYNPQSYHLGSVWAVENGSILFGLRRYGFDDRTEQLARALYDLALLWPDGRIPEAVGGYAREDYPVPGAYPRANAPQAWNQSIWAILVQTLLGMRPAGELGLLLIVPKLPAWLPEITLRGLRVGRASVDIRFHRDDRGRSRYDVLSKRGRLRVLRQPPKDALHVGIWDRLGALADTVLPF